MNAALKEEHVRVFEINGNPFSIPFFSTEINGSKEVLSFSGDIGCLLYNSRDERKSRKCISRIFKRNEALLKKEVHIVRRKAKDGKTYKSMAFTRKGVVVLAMKCRSDVADKFVSFFAEIVAALIDGDSVKLGDHSRRIFKISTQETQRFDSSALSIPISQPSFKRWLKNALEKGATSPVDLCRAIGVSDGASSKWTQGSCMPKPETQKLIEEYFSKRIGRCSYCKKKHVELTCPEMRKANMRSEKSIGKRNADIKSLDKKRNIQYVASQPVLKALNKQNEILDRQNEILGEVLKELRSLNEHWGA